MVEGKTPAKSSILTPESLFSNARRDPERTLAEISGLFGPCVRKFVKEAVSKKGASKDDVDDLVQEIFLTLVRCHERIFERLDPRRGRFRNLLYGIGNNVLASWMEREYTQRRRGRNRNISLDEASLKAIVQSAYSAPEDDTFSRAFSGAFVREALQALEKEDPTQFTSVIEFERLRDPALGEQAGAETKYQSIAGRTKRNISDVKNDLHRGRKFLRRYIETRIDEGYGDLGPEDRKALLEELLPR
jgi:DNA-directed RNA polymerase specialized sigma24 family protein